MSKPLTEVEVEIFEINCQDLVENWLQLRQAARIAADVLSEVDFSDDDNYQRCYWCSYDGWWPIEHADACRYRLALANLAALGVVPREVSDAGAIDNR